MTNSFLLVFYGALLALGVAELVKRWKFILKDSYWEYSLWSVLLFLIATYNWFIMKGRLEFVSESYLNFLVMMVPPILFFLLVSIFVPEDQERTREHFLSYRKKIFMVMSLFIASNIIAGFMNGNDDPLILGIRTMAVILAILAAVWRAMIFRVLLAIQLIVSLLLIFIDELG